MNYKMLQTCAACIYCCEEDWDDDNSAVGLGGGHSIQHKSRRRHLIYHSHDDPSVLPGKQGNQKILAISTLFVILMAI